MEVAQEWFSENQMSMQIAVLGRKCLTSSQMMSLTNLKKKEKKNVGLKGYSVYLSVMSVCNFVMIN